MLFLHLFLLFYQIQVLLHRHLFWKSLGAPPDYNWPDINWETRWGCNYPYLKHLKAGDFGGLQSEGPCDSFLFTYMNTKKIHHSCRYIYKKGYDSKLSAPISCPKKKGKYTVTVHVGKIYQTYPNRFCCCWFQPTSTWLTSQLWWNRCVESWTSEMKSRGAENHGWIF